MAKIRLGELNLGDKFTTKVGDFTLIERVTDSIVKVASCGYFGDYLGKFSSSKIPNYESSNVAAHIKGVVEPLLENYFGKNLECCDFKNGYKVRLISNDECVLFKEHYALPINSDCWTSTVSRDEKRVLYFKKSGTIDYCEPHKDNKRIMIVCGLNKDTLVDKIDKGEGTITVKL